MSYKRTSEWTLTLFYDTPAGEATLGNTNQLALFHPVSRAVLTPCSNSVEAAMEQRSNCDLTHSFATIWNHSVAT
jgi:hypothetical protein